ncbi:MAG: cyanophycinase [Thermoanaerobaculia bacterium]
MSRRFPLAAVLGVLLLLLDPRLAFPDSFVITGARVADGTGGPLKEGSVRVEGDRIAAVGKLTPRKGERVVDGRGLVLAPGFIDIHNHSEEELLSQPLAETQVSQGITTVVQGPDGGSAWPISDYLRKLAAAPPAVNVMTMVGHATVREMVMGKDHKRVATEEEVARMAALVEQGMHEGAAGLSSGLEYEVGSYSGTEELVELSEAAARHGGFYMSHVRDEADRTFEAFREAIAIGELAKIPVQISHIKMGVVGMWNRAPEAVALFEQARDRGLDVTADCYPYEAWHSNMEVLVPNKRYDDPESVAEALADVGGAARITITECKAHPDYNGRTLEEIAKAEGITPVELYIRMIPEGGAGIIGHSMTEKDVETFYRRPWVMVGSDGGIDVAHPRGAGTFPKVLGRYVREKRWLTLPEAIRKMTSLPAKRLKLADRGEIRVGRKADLVLFDPKTVADRSTFEKPRELSVGIAMVFVNGEAVWENGKAPGARPGRALVGGGAEVARGSGSGSLLIVGGGPIPDSIVRRFVELAGGSGRARIAVLPMASEDPDAGTKIVKDFEKLGATAERIALDPAAEGFEEAPGKLEGMTGIWFGGGDQSRLTAALGGTPVEKAIRERFASGAVIGGTSAGAAVMSTPMITGDEKHPGGSRPPKDPSDSASAFLTIARDNIVTKEGFDLLPGAIVDQHFVRRRRHNRLISLVLEHPDKVGVGIDESTALEVGPDGRWKVLGESVAVVYDARKARVTAPGQPLGAADVRMQVLPPGSVYDPTTGQAQLPR